MQGVKGSGSRVGLCPEPQTLSTRNPGQVLHTKPYNPARSQPGGKTGMMTYFPEVFLSQGPWGYTSIKEGANQEGSLPSGHLGTGFLENCHATPSCLQGWYGSCRLVGLILRACTLSSMMMFAGISSTLILKHPNPDIGESCE